MNELIKISSAIIGSNEVNAVNARELHEFLESNTRFNDWITYRVTNYGFTEGVDFIHATENSVTPTGAVTRIEYTISLDMAKELAMVERNAKGKEARQYFIAAEKRMRALEAGVGQPQPMALEDMLIEAGQKLKAARLEKEAAEAMLIQSEQHVGRLANQIEEIAPKARAFARIMADPDWLNPRDMAKLVGMKPGKFTQWLRDNKWLCQRSDTPLQDRIDRGHMDFKYYDLNLKAYFAEMAPGRRPQPVITEKGQDIILMEFGLGRQQNLLSAKGERW